MIIAGDGDDDDEENNKETKENWNELTKELFCQDFIVHPRLADVVHTNKKSH